MAKILNLDVVTESVEEEGQLMFLSKYGCTIFQDYCFNKTMPAAELNGASIWKFNYSAKSAGVFLLIGRVLK